MNTFSAFFKNEMRRRSVVLTFYFLLAFVLVHYVGNVLTYRGTDVVEMYHPMRLLTLSYDGESNMMAVYLMYLYPFLLVFPTGFSFAEEQVSNTALFLASRAGVYRYRVYKVLTSFLVTFLVFTVPFLVEIPLNCLAFPIKAQGTLNLESIYDEEFVLGVQRYIGTWLYLCSPYLYAAAGTLLFGAISGLLAAFTTVFSMLVRVKYKVLLFLPAYVLLNLPALGATLFHIDDVSLYYLRYLLTFDDIAKCEAGYWALLAALALFVAAATALQKRRDWLQ